MKYQADKTLLVMMIAIVAMMAMVLLRGAKKANTGNEQRVCVIKGESSAVIPITDLSVKDQILNVAEEEGFKSTWVLLKLVKCESTFNPKAVGDHGKAFGLYQIHIKIHKITKKQAFNVDFSTRWTINKLRQGECHIWTCCPKGYGHKKFN